MLPLDDYARACCYSPNGHLIAVGMGGDVGRGKRPKDGTVVIVQTQKQSLDVVKELKNASEWISDIKFSPNGELLAVASHDNKVYVYDCLANFALKCACSGASSYIKHIDFATDSSALQCSTGAYELLYFIATSGEILHDGAEEVQGLAVELVNARHRLAGAGRVPAVLRRHRRQRRRAHGRRHAHGDG